VGKLDGKVAFITGAARGQGRSHALTLAREGCDIVAVDVCAQIESVAYKMPGPEELDETARLVEKLGRRVVTKIADVRDLDALTAAAAAGAAELGTLDIVLANAGILSMIGELAQTPAAWHDSIDVMLTGVHHTILATMDHLRSHQSGSIVITSSGAGLKGMAVSLEGSSIGKAGYTAAKFGVVGLMKLYANALGPENIRVNCVHPMVVDTPMVTNPEFEAFIASSPAHVAGMSPRALPVPIVQPEDISNAILWLVSDDARYVTGVQLPVDAGGFGR
jgi:SDR family mycofactocin-dependent oxidoreductase